jgi:hypothetical protein
VGPRARRQLRRALAAARRPPASTP